MKSYHTVLGIMAGSSMDGIDLAVVKFNKDDETDFLTEFTKTIEYPAKIHSLLSSALSKSKASQASTDNEFGTWIGEQINEYIDSKEVDLIAVHGHTLIHDPDIQGISWQLGNGQVIADMTRMPCVTNFRNKDIFFGGQGAPLVPFGDYTLFNEFDACLNLGGIANVSVSHNKTAWDICPCNQVLNYYSKSLGFEFDKNGEMGRKGEINQSFLQKLLSIEYFNKKPPKSLPNSFINESFLNSTNPLDGIASYYEFISQQTSSDLKTSKPGKMLITGGGAHNTFLIKKLNMPFQNGN